MVSSTKANLSIDREEAGNQYVDGFYNGQRITEIIRGHRLLPKFKIQISLIKVL